MDLKVTAPVVEKENTMPGTSGSRSCPSKKNKGKVPKRVHKSEREKLKREHLNDLFLDLANSLELTQQNGKASILTEATRILKDMFGLVESLKKENAALMCESQYVAVEKNELRDETSALEAQIEKLQTEIEARIAQSKPDLNVAPDFQETVLTQQYLADHLRLPALEPPSAQAPVVGPVYVIPFASAHQDPTGTHTAPNPISSVSKPHARYPTPADSWPSQLLGGQQQARR